MIVVIQKNKVDFIGIQETKRESFTHSSLKSLVGNRVFQWNYLPLKATTGGILVGVDGEVFEVINWEILNFSVSL